MESKRPVCEGCE